MDLFKILGTIAVENDKANSAIDETADKASGAEGKMSGAFKKIGAAVATYFAVDQVISFGKEVVNVAATVAAETSAFEQIMGNYTDEASKKVGKIADATGMVDTRLTPYMTSMTAKFKGLGYGVSDATDYASRGLTLAADASAFWDKSLDESMSHLNSFINGSYEGGEAIGLFANDTQMASYAVKTGLISETKEWASLDEARKQATRLEYAENMMKASGATGQAAKEAGQYANVQANLTEKWRQFKAQIGEPILQNVVLPAMSKLSDLVDIASQKFTVFKEWVGQVKDKLVEVGSYASEKFKPAFDKLKDVFDKLSTALQPVIDKIKEYFSSGEAGEDATNFLKDAVDALAGVLDTIATTIQTVVDKFKDMKNWAEQNKTALTLIGVAVGTLTAAIGAYNIAMAIKNAGGIVELAQLAATAIGVGALTVAETAHTVATTIATAATTAFGAAMSFLTSPITLVILAIGALIAVGVLLVKNWDKIKQWFSDLWEKIKESFSKFADWFGEKWNSIKTFLSGIWDSIVSAVTTAWEWVKNIIQTALMLIGSAISAAVNVITLPFRFIWENCKQYVFAAWEWIKSKVTAGINAVKSVITTVMNAVKKVFTTVWNAIKSAVSTAINAVKSVITKVMNAIKAFITPILNAIKTAFTTAWNNIKSAITTAVNAIKSVVTRVWNSIKSAISTVMNAIKSKVSSIWNSIKSTLSSVMNSIKSKVTSVWNGIKSSITNAANGVKSKVTSVFNSVKTAITKPIEAAKSKVKSAVDAIKGFFSKMKLKLPNIKLPHFKVTGKLSISPPSVPKLSIDWYKKAMNNPMLLNDPTIFGYNPETGSFMGGGEAGSEVVSGTSSLMQMIKGAVASENGVITYYLQKIIVILAEYFPQILEALDFDFGFDADLFVKRHTPKINKELAKISGQKERGR